MGTHGSANRDQGGPPKGDFGTAYAEVLTSHPDPPSRGPRAMLAVAAVALLAGVGLGVNLERGQSDRPDDPADSPSNVALAGGDVLPVTGQDRSYRVSVYNAGTEPVEVLYLEANTISPPPRTAPRPGTVIAPDTWQEVGLRLPRGCSYVDTVKLLAVVVQGSGTESVLVRLPRFSGVLRDHYVLHCSARQKPTPTVLAGVWTVEPESRRPTAGRLVLQLTRDGSFTSQDDVSRDWDLAGSYRLRGDRLVIHIARGHTFTCGPGDRLAWRASLLEDGRLALDFPDRREDACGEPAGATWVASRILDQEAGGLVQP